MTARHRRLVVIDVCEDCPHYLYIGPVCLHPETPDRGGSVGREIKGERIPSWCPLERAP